MHAESRWPYLGILVLGLTAVSSFWLIAQCGPAGSWRQETYIEAVAGRPLRVNPIFAAQNDVDGDLSALVFSGLTRLTPDGRVEPDLAQSWETSPDSRTFTFYLRPGVTWHDGMPLTVDDVLFTIALLQEAAKAEEARVPPFWKDIQVSGRAPGAVTITLPEPLAQFPAYIAIGLLPKHRLNGMNLQALKQASFNQAPIGTGPFVLEEVNASRAVLRANPRYWSGRPRFRRLEFHFYPNADAQLEALNQGAAQGALIMDRSPAEVQTALAPYHAFTPVLLPHGETDTLYFNVAAPQLADLDVRHALALAIERAALARLEGDRALPALMFGLPFTWTAGEAGPAPDMAKAQALLDVAGWQIDASGRRSKDGQPLRIVLTTTSEPERVARARAIVDRWQSLGVDARLEPLSPELVVREALGPRRFDAILLSRTDPAEPDIFADWHSSQTTPDRRNLANLMDSTLDRLGEEARRQPDPEQRLVLYRTAAQVLERQMPALPLLHPLSVYVIDSRLRGVEVKVLFTPSSRFMGIERWYLAREG